MEEKKLLDKKERIKQKMNEKLHNEGYSKKEPSVYRSFKNQLGRMIDKIFDPESKFYFLHSKVSEDILIDIIFKYTEDISPTERKIKSQIDNYKGMKYDVGIFTLSLEELTEEVKIEYDNFTNTYSEQINEINEFYNQWEEKINPENYAMEIQEFISQIGVVGPSSMIEELIKANDCIYNNLLWEKEEANKYGLDSVYYLRVAQYIGLSKVIIYNVLYMCFLTEHITRWKKQSLDEITKSLLDMIEKWDYRIKYISCEKPIQAISISPNETDRKITGVTQVFVLYLQSCTTNEEEKLIQEALIKNLYENNDFFQTWMPLKHFRISDYASEAELIQNIKMDDKNPSKNDYEKLEIAKQIVSKMGLALLKDENDNDDCAFSLRLVYRQLLMNKAVIQRKGSKNALTIVKDWIYDGEIENRDVLFLEEQILRGKFYEVRKVDRYEQYCVLRQKITNILMDIWKLGSDKEMYNEIYLFIKEFLFLMKNNTSV